ncbi:MAG: YraN family protein [Betaproteobacteria bacterium]|nr:YraN family protein [Betaproteobacteria bacterium]
MKGKDAETLAAEFLARKGVVITQRNYRCRFGEIDLIARDGATLVFVEVRSRRREAYGGAAESITAAKRARLIHAARHYLATAALDTPARFDAILIRGEPPRIEWIRGAFNA